MRHRCVCCSRIITSNYAVCLTCRKKTEEWRKRNRKKVNQSMRTWRLNNLDKVAGYKRAYKRKYPERVRLQVIRAHSKYGKTYRKTRWEKWIKTKYGLSESEFYLLVKRQKGRCAICGLTQQCGQRRTLYLDHDHKRGERAFRGLLCFRCNTMLGMARDKISALKAAIAYLLRWKKHGLPVYKLKR